MAIQTGIITVNGINIIECDTDPSISGGLIAPIGSFASAVDGSGFYYKSTAGNTGWILSANSALVLPIESSQKIGTALTFLTDSFYGTIGNPETGDITYSDIGAKLGVTNIIIHNSSVYPTFAANMKKLSISGTYTLNVINYIIVTYVNSTEIIYAISQRT